MAHENCIGKWIHSTFGGSTPDGTGADAGVFVISPHTGEVITGKHLGHGNSDIVGKCDGTNIRFCMSNKNTGEVICYRGTISLGTGSAFINGRFTRPLEDSNAIVETAAIVILEGKRVLVAPDDWTAERPT